MSDELLTDAAHTDVDTAERKSGRKAEQHGCRCSAEFAHPVTGKIVTCACPVRTPNATRICYFCRPNDVHYRLGGPFHTPPDTPVFRTTGLEWQQAHRAAARR